MSGTWYDPSGTPRSPNAPTSGDDSFVGSDGQDYVFDENGDPTSLVAGGEGNDTLDGRGGDDFLVGNEGDDSLLGGEGADALQGGAGNDTLLGGEGDDGLNGGPGNDWLFGGAGSDTVELAGNPEGYLWQPTVGGWNVIDLDPSDGDDGSDFIANDVEWVTYGGTGETVQTPCFAAGTRVMTARGEVPVEALRAGDLVVTLGRRGAWLRPVRWIGRRRVDGRRHPRPEAVLPVRIRAGALGPGTPHRDLRVSPDHALFLDGVLVPAAALVDGETILQEAAGGPVTYYHVELDAHDLLLAEGAPAESWLDCGNRHQFDNAGVVVALHARFEADRASAERCAELALPGTPALGRVLERLARRRAVADGAARMAGG